MGNFLASVGRAQPTRNVLQVLQGKMMMDQNARREQLTASELAMNNEQLAQMKRQAEAQDRLRQEGEMPVSVEGYAGKFEGGPDGEIFKYVYNLVDSAGYIDKSTGGMGTFQRRHMPEIGQLLSDPQVVSKLSQMRINLGLKNEAQARQMLAEKPDDQKALQAWQESITYLDTVRGQDKNWQAEKKRQAEEMKAKAAMINATKTDSGDKNLTEMQLTKRALAGDPEAQAILDSMTSRKIEIGKASAQGKIEGLFNNIDVEGSAKAIIEGRETIENVKNTFGVPIQEAVRKKVLETDSEFNFLLPRAVVRSLDTSLKGQEKQRGLMGSFVRNIEKQVTRVDEIAKEIDRWGIRALDLPKRELITRLKGSGKEKVLEAYLTEISAEIGKLSTGSSASIRELSTEAQARWNKIHDPNLSLKELSIILEETRDMAKMRISSTNEEIEFTKERLKNLKTGSSSTLQRSVPQPQKQPSKFEILSVED